MRGLLAGVAFLAISAAGVAGALERVARPILDIDAPDDESRVEEWRSSCDVPVNYYNTCTGWLWAWSDFNETLRPTTIYDVDPCTDVPPMLTHTFIYAVDAVPAGYGYTGSIAVHAVNANGCPTGAPIAQQPFLPTTSAWTTISWGGFFVPNRFAVVYREPPGSMSPLVLATDHPAAGPSGPQALGHCYPSIRPTHSYFHDSTASSCALTPLFDGVGNAEWLWTCIGYLQPKIPSPPPFVQLTVSAGAGGTALPPSGTYPAGSNVTLLAVPDSNYIFHSWSGSGFESYSGTDNPRMITLQDNVTEVANFILATVQLSVTAEAGGTALPPSGTYLRGSNVTLLAVPESNYFFQSWSGTGIGSYTGTDNPRMITLQDNVTEVASFIVATEVTFHSDPPGMRLLVDGAEERMPVQRNWPPNSLHDVEVDSLIVEAPSTRVRFIEWGDGVTSLHRTYQVPVFGPVSVTARFNREFRIEVADSYGGSTANPPEWAAEGSQHSILAIPNFGFEFVAWDGSGAGSYSGPANPATITALGPIHETPIFSPIYAGNGSNFTISASDLDPHVTSSPATGTIRSLHLWLTCSDRGISAFEANVTGSLTPLGFSPAPGVLNVGTADHLLLAVGGCPNGAPSPYRLGEWILVDEGGTICLSSEPSGVFATVDCDAVNPSLWSDPRVEGFASDGSAPCVVGNNGCAGTPVFPTSIAAGGPEPPLATRIIAMRPNPFTRECRVEYSLARDAMVRLNVFDVRGRRLRSLVGRIFPAGLGAETWDGRNDDGGRVPGGVYFIVLDTGDVRETKKVVFLSGRD